MYTPTNLILDTDVICLLLQIIFISVLVLFLVINCVK
jgi:hypothetical protein